MAVQVLGLCRFSLIVEGGFQAQPETLEARRLTLYDRARLDSRFLWFEHVCLPALKAQTDPDFTLVLLTGVDLPSWALARLRDLIAPIPQVVLRQEPPAVHRPLCRRVLDAHRDRSAMASLQFRLDDDDAVAVDFVERLRADFLLLGPMFAREKRLYLDYMQGMSLIAPPGAEMKVVRQVADRISAGLAIAFRPEDDACVMSFAHHKVHHFMAGMTFSDTAMYVRGKHDSNDSIRGVLRHDGMEMPLDPEEIVPMTGARFALDLDAFDGALAARGSC
ncbi:glycosyltransferase [Falsirhodobacter halotolerans]|uniref:glycosyltransferase n=1 Tax=Falsirhodobacter halotolerans TaxID=1146892 RepID=UPI001FD432E5|nr:glycosyltransferase [Falsirhodobacter halotolerans]MCJ8138514.1 putative rhamnosyl transferase [Falsirhodobacter halotolerans]